MIHEVRIPGRPGLRPGVMVYSLIMLIGCATMSLSHGGEACGGKPVSQAAGAELAGKLIALRRRHPSGDLGRADTVRLRDLFQSYGWPSVEASGADAVNAAGSLLLRVGSDRGLQNACLDSLLAREDVDPRAVGDLFDRIAMAHREPQVFGTVFELAGGVVRPSGALDERMANQFRDQLGLPLLGEDMEHFDSELRAGRSFPEITRVPALARPAAISNAALRAELLSMEQADQRVRSEVVGCHARGVAPTACVRAERAEIELDRKHEASIKEIIGEHGFPTRAMIGRRGLAALALLVQHAPDLDFQRDCLPSIEQLMKRLEISRQSYALLVDRVLIRSGEKQLYGTQLDESARLLPVQKPEQLDSRRAALGLSSIEQYLQISRSIAK